MAKGAYIGVSSIARRVKKFYIGQGGVAHAVKKAYIGVNGVARLFWSGESYQSIIINKDSSNNLITKYSLAKLPVQSSLQDGASFTPFSGAYYNNRNVIFNKPKQCFVMYMGGTYTSYANLYGGYIYTMPLGGSTWTAKAIQQADNYSIYICSAQTKWCVNESNGDIYFPSMGQSNGFNRINKLVINSDGTALVTGYDISDSGVMAFQSLRVVALDHVNDRYFLGYLYTDTSHTTRMYYFTNPESPTLTASALIYSGSSGDNAYNTISNYYRYSHVGVDYCNGKWYVVAPNSSSDGKGVSIQETSDFQTFTVKFGIGASHPYLKIRSIRDHKVFFDVTSNYSSVSYFKTSGAYYIDLMSTETVFTPVRIGAVISNFGSMTDMTDDGETTLCETNYSNSHVYYSVDRELTWTDGITNAGNTDTAPIARGIA